MTICPACEHENREAARFCDSCGSSLDAAPAFREQRKTVTVLFCDVTGSTALGESTDPEALRALLARYFGRMKGIVESHGGTVEKFIGDAVMAVFGVPQVHEDDALRAVRAAVEMRDALPELGVQARIGVNTGEVVTGTEERLATGDAVNVAARLEQAASPGEILIGEETLSLVRDAVETKPVEPLELKGKAGVVPAHQLIGVTRELQRRHVAPMVGRETELHRLRAAYEQAAHDRSCQLFTVLGNAGVGKSRLAAEFVIGLDATVVRGRCLPYGEGITYWPVVEILTELDIRPPGNSAATAIAALLGESEETVMPDEIPWAVRKTLELGAAEHPLVVVFDDIHWGEPALLDLVEHVADFSRGAPILLLCIGRPELLERRHGWGGGKLNATTVLLEPLSAEETDELIERLGQLDQRLRERVREAAEGNPLFVEEMLAMVREAGNGDVTVPPTIQALLAARIDQLDAAERAVLERGAVEGKLFHGSAVAALAPEVLKADVSAHLLALVRKEFVRPDESEFGDEDAFRFRHLLLRDAAYDALPKAERAELHERFADWLEEKVGERRPAYQAIVGYHLEQAYRCRDDLGLSTGSLGERAGRALAAASRTALERGDSSGAVSLLSRAIELLPAEDRDRSELLVDLAHAAFVIGDYARSADASEELIRAGESGGDARLEWRGRMQALVTRLFTDPSIMHEEVESAVQRALPVLEQAGDEAGLARALHLRSYAHHNASRSEEQIKALEQALQHARSAGDVAQQAEIIEWLAVAHFFGPTPVDEARARLEHMLAEARAKPWPSVEGVLLRFLGGLEGLRGRFDEARDLFDQGGAILVEMGRRNWLAGQTQITGYVELISGDYEAAEREFRFGYDEYERMGETGVRSTSAAMLADALYEQGRYDEAELYADVCRETAAVEDRISQIGWRTVTARVLARRRQLAESERLAREAAALSVETNDLYDPTAWSGLGEVLAVSGKREEAASAFGQALRLLEQKGNLAGASHLRAVCAELGVEPVDLSAKQRSV